MRFVHLEPVPHSGLSRIGTWIGRGRGTGWHREPYTLTTCGRRVDSTMAGALSLQEDILALVKKHSDTCLPEDLLARLAEDARLLACGEQIRCATIPVGGASSRLFLSPPPPLAPISIPDGATCRRNLSDALMVSVVV